MVAPGIDERAHWGTLSAAITVTLGADRVLKYGEVPGLDGNEGVLPPIFALLTISRRFVAPAKSSRRADSSGWRASVVFAGRTVDEAAWAGMRITQALEDVRFTIGGHVTTPVHLDTSRDIKPDGQRLSGKSAWVYAI